ncbi:MAG: 30S ribosomal protein S20 [Spirochaetaceae bacterium]|nr:30S ribosomal protein S20 [Spirochaetaceae bacterium]
MKNLSVIKRQKQNEARRLRNKSVKSSVRTCAKKYITLVRAGDSEKAQATLRELSSKLDSAARKGIISRNAAARKKSRMQKYFNTSFAK